MSEKAKKPVLLIVDDDETILGTLRVALSTFYTVETASSAARGVVMARNTRPHVIILDIRMPEHDGFWLFAEIRKVLPDVPIIFNSAYQDVVSPSEVKGMYEPFAYLPKTGSLKTLLSVVDQAVKSRSDSSPPVKG